MTELVVFTVYAFLVGACVGSFLNVVIYRLPAGESLSLPPSHCYTCQQPIAWYDNIPMLSWLVLRGRCRCAQVPISPRYPLIELGTALLWAALTWRYGVQPLTAVYLLLSAVLVAIAFIDLDEMIIPDVMTYPGMALGVALAGLGVLPIGLVASLAGLGAGFLILGSVYYGSILALGQEGMGLGDVKYLMMVGAFLGWEQALLLVVLAAALGTVILVPMLALGIIERGKPFPFGPFLVLGTLACLFGGREFLDWYLAGF